MSNYTNSTVPTIPQRWIISPLDPGDRSQCPPAAASLLTFLTTNILASIIGVAFGSRLIVHQLTFQKFGNRFLDRFPSIDSRYGYTWIIPFCVQLFANLIIAIMIKRSPGYEGTSIGDIMLLYLFRPRLSWIFLAIPKNYVVYQHSTGLYFLSKPGKKSLKHLWGQPGTYFWEPYNTLWYEGVDLESPWQPSAVSGAVAEAVMQLVAVIYVNVTWQNSDHLEFLPLTWMILFSYSLPIIIIQLLFPWWPVAVVSYGFQWGFFALLIHRAGEL